LSATRAHRCGVETVGISAVKALDDIALNLTAVDIDTGRIAGTIQNIAAMIDLNLRKDHPWPWYSARSSLLWRKSQ
jgi:hypothetical protein